MQRPIVGRLTPNKCRVSKFCALGSLKKHNMLGSLVTRVLQATASTELPSINVKTRLNGDIRIAMLTPNLHVTKAYGALPC
jgi:hypothetical protein